MLLIYPHSIRWEIWKKSFSYKREGMELGKGPVEHVQRWLERKRAGEEKEKLQSRAMTNPAD